MVSYHAKYRKGRIIPLENPPIPEDSDLIITVLEPQSEDHAQRQHAALLRFMEGMETTPPLPPLFDEIMSQRVNVTREIDL